MSNPGPSSFLETKSKVQLKRHSPVLVSKQLFNNNSLPKPPFDNMSRKKDVDWKPSKANKLLFLTIYKSLTPLSKFLFLSKLLTLKLDKLVNLKSQNYPLILKDKRSKYLEEKLYLISQ